jgi:pimeloyl-ACP methyl ester carboxylesterase
VPTTRRVASTGLDLCVREHSPPGPDRPTLVLVHGYPDQQEMWGAVVAALPLGELHVVSYDVRGAGASGVPDGVAGYRTERLVDDLAAVLDATLPAGARAHLVGHDWGSVQLWDAVTTEASDPRLRARIASFTSIAGPSLDHTAWLARHPRGRAGALLRQLAHSWYVAFFQVPFVPELLWRLSPGALRRSAERVEGAGVAHWGPDLPANASRGVNLYRANVPRRLLAPRRVRTDVPVLVLQPTGDNYLTGALDQELERVCSDVRVVAVPGGHWATRTHPEQVAALVLEHVRAHA